MNRYRIHIAITIAVMLFIFIQSAMPGDVSSNESNFIVSIISDLTGLEAASLSLFVRKAAHFTEYLILGVCLSVNIRDWLAVHEKPMYPVRHWFVAWMATVVYAATDEIHQYFVPDRACTFADVCIDAAGAAIGALIVVATSRCKCGDK